MKVVKFGGSSLADGQQYRKVIQIIKADPERRVVVVSAPGCRQPNDEKVTDLLIKYARQVIKHANYQDVLECIIRRYQAIADYFNLSATTFQPLKSILRNLPNHQYPDDQHLLAAFKAHGERLNARLMALILTHLGISAEFIDPSQAGILVQGKDPNNAIVEPQTYRNLAKLKPLLKQPVRLIFPGFFGFTSDHYIATFARGGSDITGSILAKGLGISLYENFTDVDAIYAANPKLIPHPEPIKKLTYREMRELSYAGFSVFNEDAIIPAIQGNITINVKNTNHPAAPGTYIVPSREFVPKHLITGIAESKGFDALYLHKYLINHQVGFTNRLLNILTKYGVAYEHMPSGIDDLTVVIKKDMLTKEKMADISKEVQAKLHPDQLKWEQDYAIIMIVGEGMRNKPGVITRVVEPLSHQGISIRMINQGSSQISMMLDVKDTDADEAVKRIYNEFFV